MSSSKGSVPGRLRTWALAAGLMVAAPLSVPTSGAVASAQEQQHFSEQPVPVIAGRGHVGSIVSAEVGRWPAGTSFRFQWYADDRPIGGATKSQYRISRSQGNRSISVISTATKAGYESVSSRSATIAVTAARPVLNGEAVVSRVLSIDPGTWPRGTELTYQWYADGRPLRGVTSHLYWIRGTQLGRRIHVAVSGTLANGDVVIRQAQATPRVSRIGVPRTSGATEVGSTVSVDPGSWGSGTRFSYQWYADGRPIRGSTGSSYAISASQLGRDLTVLVTGRQPGYQTMTVEGFFGFPVSRRAG